MRTTVDLPDEVFRQAKARAALEGRKLKDLITDYVRQGLSRQSPVTSAAPRQRSNPPLFVRPDAGDEPLPFSTNAEIEEILLREEIERYQTSLT